MKKLLATMLIGVGLAAGATPAAHAFTVDTLLFSADLGNSGDATETAALAGFLGLNPTDLTLDLKLNSGDVGFNVAADGPGQWVINVAPTEPGYFLLKFGTGGFPATPDTYYFQNIAELTKLVWTNSQVGFLSGGCGSGRCNIGRLSHFTTFDGGGGNQAPEPGTLALLGLAFAVLGAMRRRFV